MGIYINGLNIPKDREQYHRVTIYGNGQVIIDHGTYYEEAEAIPSADVRPVEEGYWIENCTDYICAACGGVVSDEIVYMLQSEGLPDYCPNCGAKMGGVTNG